MKYRLIASIPQELADMAVEIRLALGLEPQNSCFEVYRPFEKKELTDEEDVSLIALFKTITPLELIVKGRMKWNDTTGFLYYPVENSPSLVALRQILQETFSPEYSIDSFLPNIPIGTIHKLGRNQSDLVNNLFVPASWSASKFLLQRENEPDKWALEAGYDTGVI